jgi:hypothetical protein
VEYGFFIAGIYNKQGSMFKQVFKNIDDVLWKEAGCTTTDLDYTGQTSWLLFLKYLDGLEQDKAMEAELEGKKYSFILDEPYRWESWAAPKNAGGKLAHNNALTGDDLRDFVDRKLFPYLHGIEAPNIVHLGKTNPLNDADLAEFVELQKTFADSPKSWSIDTSSLSATEGLDLSVKNPNGGEAIAHRSPQAIVDAIAALDAESTAVLGNIQNLLSGAAYD